MHHLVHLFDDILNKGATANYSMKPGEQMHAALHQIYSTTSWKNATVDKEVWSSSLFGGTLIICVPQILRKNHATMVYNHMQIQIDAHDAALLAQSSTLGDTEAENVVVHAMLGSGSN
jgi:hypothetical protein